MQKHINPELFQRMVKELPVGKSATPAKNSSVSGSVLFEITNASATFFVGGKGIKTSRKEK